VGTLGTIRPAAGANLALNAIPGGGDLPAIACCHAVAVATDLSTKMISTGGID
jgi:hypothetical protein